MASGISDQDSSESKRRHSPVPRDIATKPTVKHFAPILLCLSDRLVQTEVVKEDSIETDVTIFRNLERAYCEALNPVHRWLPRSLINRQRWLCNKVKIWKIASTWILAVETVIWLHLLCPLFRMVSLWDLREIKEAKVKLAAMYILTKSSSVYGGANG